MNDLRITYWVVVLLNCETDKVAEPLLHSAGHLRREGEANVMDAITSNYRATEMMSDRSFLTTKRMKT
jgi:hypothetical protein